MLRNYRYHPLFEYDLLDAARWYDERQNNLGTDFVNRVRLAIEELGADPDSRSTIDFGIRYWPVKRFPYVVFYECTTSEILILGVMHLAKDSRKWLVSRT